MLPVVVVCVVAFITIFITRFVYKWSNPECKNGILPPGSMGFPIIGETLELLVPGRSLDIHPFIKKRLQRYGPIFRTSLVGKPVVISADPQVNHYLFLQEGKSVELWYMDTFTKLFDKDEGGKTDAFTAPHRYSRSIVLNHFGVDSLKGKLLPKIEKQVYETLQCWSEKNIIDVKSASAKMVFDFTAQRMFSYDAENHPEDLSEKFTNFLQSLMSFPLNIPGTAFHDCLKKKDKVVNVIREKLHEKLNSPEPEEGDLLDQVIKEMKTEAFITENFAINFIFGALFAGFEAISSTLTLAFKLLSDHPSIVDELMAEHEAILSKKMKGETLTWEEYKSMTFTIQVINEVLRLSSMAPGFLRRTTKDVQVNGYTIPKGWTVMVATSAQQLNPDTYKDPLAFNPHRWKELDSIVISRNFMPFGAGTRQCAGAEYTRVFMAIFFHVLCTKYSWKKVKGGDNITRKPFLDFGDGIIIKLSEKASPV